jgi:tRNA modification GTPase
VRLTDTAGLRDSDDPIEAQGIERSRRSIASAQVTFWLLDASSDDIADELAELEKSSGANTIAVWNKCDLVPDRELPETTFPACRISAVRGEGTDQLLECFKNIISANGEQALLPESAVNARMADALERAYSALERADIQLEMEDFELAACDLADAAYSVGETTGKTASCDLLDEVFHRFCLGK